MPVADRRVYSSLRRGEVEGVDWLEWGDQILSIAARRPHFRFCRSVALGVGSLSLVRDLCSILLRVFWSECLSW